MIPIFAAAFLIPLIISLLVTPLVIKFANFIGATDLPDKRKVHTTAMPRIGGLAVVISISATIIALYYLFSGYFPNSIEGSYNTLIVIFCFAALFALGFFDDLNPLSAGVKFGVQFILAGAIYFAGFQISNITNPLGDGVFNIGIFDLPITVLWIVGVTNAFNLIDGLDGLASGVAVIACLAIFVITSLSAQFEAALFSLIIAGSLVGFLRYNFNPAKIFLGDSGSLTIGFALALLSIQGTAKITTGFAVLLPVLILVLPLTDTLVSMVRRLIGSFLNREPKVQAQSFMSRIHGMFAPDKLHIHHRLLSFGLSHRNTVLVLYAVSMFFACSAILFTQIETFQRSLSIALVLGLALIVFIRKMRYSEMAVLKNGLFMNFYERWILKQSRLICIADAIFIIISFSLAYTLVFQANTTDIEYLSFGYALMLVLPIQLVTLWFTGLYREKANQFGMANALHILASIGSAVWLTGIVFLLIELPSLMEVALFFTVDFYFLVTFLFGYRVTYQALRYWFNRHKKAGSNVLIYGAGIKGTSTLQNIINSSEKDIQVIGFIDDDPDMEGKLVYGYPILGGHWVISKTHKNHKIDSIYLCDENIRCENLKRLRYMALQKKITIKKLNITHLELENIDFFEEEIQVEAKDEVSYLQP